MTPNTGANRMNITIYTTPTCGYCHHAKEYLRQRGVEFIEHDVSVDRDAAEEMVAKSGQTGVPVIVIDDHVVIGFDRAQMDRLLSDGDDSHRPHFGLKIADATRAGPKMGLPPVFGALVGNVAPDSIGDKAGIQPGDIITEFNLRPIRNANDLENATATVSEGKRALFVLIRGQQTLKSEVIL